jgi:6-phosphogluconate dehydrogenase
MLGMETMDHGRRCNMQMRIGMVGLGRMGANMARRLMDGGHECVVYDPNREAVETLKGEGAMGAESLQDLARLLEPRRVVWIMVPAGATTETVVQELAQALSPEDILIDGGNSHFKDDVRRARALTEWGIRYLDVGTSGGVWGRARGYCLMVGGAEETCRHVEPVLETLAPGPVDVTRDPDREHGPRSSEKGYLYCGPPGAGHFVKMVHNGIEYGMMQAYAEGFGILEGAASEDLPAAQRYRFDLNEIAEVWRHGSVIESWLLDLTARALREDACLGLFTGRVPDSGEGRWTVQAAVEEGVAAEVIAAALFARFRSQQDSSFSGKVLSAMREQFGGHAESAPEGANRR